MTVPYSVIDPATDLQIISESQTKTPYQTVSTWDRKSQGRLPVIARCVDGEMASRHRESSGDHVLLKRGKAFWMRVLKAEANSRVVCLRREGSE